MRWGYTKETPEPAPPGERIKWKKNRLPVFGIQGGELTKKNYDTGFGLPLSNKIYYLHNILNKYLNFINYRY